MMKTNIAIFALLLCVFSSKAQTFQDYQSKFQFQFGLGVSAALVNMFEGSETDNLIQYQQFAPNLRIFSGSFFPKKRWGVNFSFDAFDMQAMNGDDKMKKFNDYLQATYSDKYHISTQYDLEDSNKEEIDLATIGRGILGVIYRIEKDRYFIYPQASIGLNTFNINNAKITLRERNSNMIEVINYDSKLKNSSLLSYHLSAKGGYKLNKVLWAHADVMLSYFRPQFSFTETRYNQTLNEHQSPIIHEYKKVQPSISLQVGLTLAFGQFKKA